MTTNPADLFDDSSANLRQMLRTAFGNVQERLLSSETNVSRLLANQSGVVDSLVGQITAQFSELFTSADQLVTAIRNAEFLTATTATPLTFTNGVEATLLLDAGNNFPFVPTSVVALTLAGNSDDYAFARVMGWQPSTRALSIEIFAAVGEAGPHTGVTVEIAAIDTLAIQTMRDDVDVKHAAIGPMHAAVVAAAPIAVQAKNDAVLAKEAAETAAQAANTWNPANYWSKLLSYSAAQVDALLSSNKDPLDRIALAPVLHLDFSDPSTVRSGWFTRSGAALSRLINGLLASTATYVARIDHARGQIKGYLCEPAATNICLRSQELDNASWTKVRCSITANAGLASDGTTTLDKIVEDGSNNSHVIEQGMAFAAGVNTLSIEAKAGERTWLALTAYDSTAANKCGANFDLVNGVVGTVSVGTAAIERLDNGNMLCSVTGAFAAGGGGVDVWLLPGNTGASYAGDGVSGAYVGEVQVEAGPAATSRIRTAGATATRNADVMTIAGTDFSDDWNPLECSVIMDFELRGFTSGSYAYLWAAKDAGGTNLLGIRVNGTTQRVEIIAMAAGVTVANPVSATTLVAGQRYRVAASFKKDAFHLSLDGAAVVSDTAGAMPTGIYQEFIGHNSGGSHPHGGGFIRRHTRYAHAIPSADLPKVSAQ